jgi:acetoacetate decarboxylase
VPNPPFAPLPYATALYPDLPHVWRGDVAVSFLCAGDRDVLKDLVPLPLTLSRTDGVFVIAAKVCRDLTAPAAPEWGQLGVQYRLDFIVPVSYDGVEGEYTCLEYINSDMGLCAGRELYSWPKKQATFDWRESAGQVAVSCHRGEDQLATLRFTEGVSGERVDWPHAGPTFNVRSLAGDRGSVTRVEVLRSDFPNFTLHSRVDGLGELALLNAPRDPLLKLFGSIEVLAARRDVRDFDLDWADVVASVELPPRNPVSVRHG